MATTASASRKGDELYVGEASRRLLAEVALSSDLEAPSQRKQATAIRTSAAATTQQRTSRCSRKTTWVSALGVLALGFIAYAFFGRCGTGYVNCDYKLDLPEGVNRAAVPVGREMRPGWMKHHAALVAEAEREGATARVLVLGDSITEELLGKEGGKTRSGWGSLAVWLQYYACLGAINLGVAGDQTQHLLWRLQNGELPDVLQPESVLVAIGTNNLGAGMDARDTVGGVKAVVQYVREQRPDAMVSVMALFPRADPKHKKSTTPWPVIDEVNRMLERMLRLKFGTKKVLFVNCSDRFVVEDDSGREVLNKEFILPDNLHLTSDGLKAWAECAEAAVHSGLRDN